MREDIKELRQELESVKEQSFARELLNDQKRQNKRMFIIILVILSMWFVTGCYLIYILNDTNTTTESIDINDVENIDNSHIKIGDDVWEE